MRRNHYHYARKWRQFRFLSKKLDRAIENGRFQHYSQRKQQHLRKKLETLYCQLKGIFSPRRLRKALAGAAILLGVSMTSPLQAQLFAPPQENPFGIQHEGFFNMPTFVDIDDDGDLDMFAAEYVYGTDGFQMRYYENTGTAEAPAFAASMENPFGIDDLAVSRPTFGDIDNDGDLDLLAGNWGYTGYSGYGSMRFYENTGDAANPQFAEPVEQIGDLQISTYSFNVVEWADLDNDGDLDLLTMQDFYGIAVYYENVGTPEAPEYGPPQNGAFGTEGVELGPRFFDLVDVDDDGDLDLITTLYSFDNYATTFYYQENLGSAETPDFDEPTPMPFTGVDVGGLYVILQPYMADIDDDGDQDLFFNVYDGETGIYGATYYFEQIQNAAPTSEDAMVTTQLNEPHAFLTTEFPFTDPDGDDLQEVRIQTLPDAGVLEFDGMPVTAGDVIPAADLGLLVFTPGQDEFGNPYTTFEFEVSDGIFFNPVPRTMSIEVLMTNSVQHPELQANIRLAPNPATDLLRVEATLQESTYAEAHLRVHSLTGQLLSQARASLFSDRLQTELNVSDLAPGMYLLEIQINGKQRTERFVKQ